jgi:hypothetical protein
MATRPKAFKPGRSADSAVQVVDMIGYFFAENVIVLSISSICAVSGAAGTQFSTKLSTQFVCNLSDAA